MRDELEEIITESNNKARARGKAEGISQGMTKGIAKGLTKGRIEGIQLTKKAIQLQALGKSADEIAKTLRISVEQAKMMTT